ncbi:protein translocase subunit SecF [bacterium]|jgi:preprotein translocase subunit SecF|nr:protein translocase subunit SecF [bacterium]
MSQTPSKIRVIQKKNLWFMLSLTIIGLGLIVMGQRYLHQDPVLNFGIDFTGGSSLILRFDKLNTELNNTDTPKETRIRFIQDVRGVLSRYQLDKSIIQIAQDREVIIRTIPLTNTQRVTLLSLLEERFGTLELLEVDIIGPSIGEELRQMSIWIICMVSIALLLYCSWRFELLYGVSALLAVLHDALIMVSFAALFNIEVNTAFVAAVLTILGYSINDTIVIFDRIRENMNRYLKQWDILTIINTSIYQMLGRTIHTSTTTLLVIVCLLIFGGTTIKPFALVLLVGVISGTYSSLLIASPLVALFATKRR